MKKILTGCLLLLSLTSANSQILSGRAAEQVNANAIELRYDARSNAPLYVEFKANSFISASTGMEGLNSILGATTNDDWRIIRRDRDDLGINHVRYQQYYKNVKVITGEYILHENQGRVVAANGMFFDHLTLNTAPAINEKQALNAALNNIHASKYLWQCSEAEQRILSGGIATNAAPQGELVVLPSLNGDRKQGINLCWQFDVYATQPHERWLVYVNAQNGKIEFKENKICTITTNGTAATKYSGTQSVKIDSLSSTSYRLRETGRGSGIETYNLQNGTNYATAVDFTSTSKAFTATANQDNAAYDAHWGAEMTYDYYLTAHSRNSYNNAGGVLKSYVHYSTSYNNAFWNGSVMTYGDGDGSTFSPLTELDICAHELSHGVTSTSSNLTYSYESGALNESFSDIFGISTDFFARPATANWTLGDQSYTPATSGDGIRYMNNPNLAGDPDTYHGTNWYTGTGDNGGVHYNSGVQNFWYYLLCTGGSGTNDVGFSYNVAGITMNKARQIAYRNNTFYLTSGSQYVDAAFYAVKSANDIFGNCSPESFSTKNAWDAVGVVGAPLNSAATASVVGGTCTGSTIQFTAAGGTTYSWSGPGGFSSSIANPTIPNASAANNGLYSCIITDASGCSGLATAVVSVSASPSVTATGGTTVCNGNTVQLNANASASGQGQNLGSNSTPLALPDYPNAGVSSSININGSTSANAIISVTIDSLTHTYDGDLKIELVSPSGSSIVLASNVGTSGDNFIRTKFVPTGTAIANGTAPFTGSFVPSAGSFAGLTGSANGTWSIKITDLGSQDIGTLWKWSIELPGNVIVSYNWSPSTGLNNATIRNPLAAPAATTTYAVQVTDNNGCTAVSSTTVTIGSLAVQTSQSNVTCNGLLNGSANVVVVNPVGTPTYLWNNGATTSSINQVAAGTYTYTVTNGNGCTATGSVNVSQPSALIPTPSVINAACATSNGSASIAMTGGTSPYQYLWNTGATTSSINGLGAGTYTVTTTDASGCSLSTSMQVTQSNVGSPNVQTTQTNVSCFGGTNGSVGVTISNPIGTPQYLWNTGSTSQNLNGMAAGTYIYTITNGNGCMTTGAISITQPFQIDGTASSTPASCGSSNGSTTVVVSGGTTPYLYSWSNGVTNANNNNLSAGTYTITVTDANGCSFSSPVTVASQGTGSPLSTPTSITGTKNGICVGATKVYGCPAVANATTYSWTVPANAVINSGQGTTSINVSFLAGFTTGAITVTASNGCATSNIKSSTLRSTPLTPGAITGTINNLCSTISNYSIAASTTGATSYTWSVPAGATIISGQGTTAISVQWPSNSVASGSICVTANNACGSSTSKCLAAVTTLPLMPSTVTGPGTACKNQTGLVYSVTGQTGATYTWTVPAKATIVNGQGTPSITVNWGPSTGSVKVTASNACGTQTTKTKSVVVNCRTGFEGISTMELIPNPNDGNATIFVGDDESGYDVFVNDMLGRTIFKDNSSAAEYNLHLGNQPKGMYLVSVRKASGDNQIFRMIIQ
ncbi:MAG TPA: M4 family metallopeptidase [Bacteroidia bacterium]|nr:M4 family metallopeptidase [Bacteroidia bacterium]